MAERWVHPNEFQWALDQRDAARRQVKKLTADLKRCQDALMRHELDRLEGAQRDGVDHG